MQLESNLKHHCYKAVFGNIHHVSLSFLLDKRTLQSAFKKKKKRLCENLQQVLRTALFTIRATVWLEAEEILHLFIYIDRTVGLYHTTLILAFLHQQ